EFAPHPVSQTHAHTASSIALNHTTPTSRSSNTADPNGTTATISTAASTSPNTPIRHSNRSAFRRVRRRLRNNRVASLTGRNTPRTTRAPTASRARSISRTPRYGERAEQHPRNKRPQRAHLRRHGPPPAADRLRQVRPGRNSPRPAVPRPNPPPRPTRPTPPGWRDRKNPPAHRGRR